MGERGLRWKSRAWVWVYDFDVRCDELGSEGRKDAYGDEEGEEHI
jgi:hypothetical protein